MQALLFYFHYSDCPILLASFYMCCAFFCWSSTLSKQHVPNGPSHHVSLAVVSPAMPCTTYYCAIRQGPSATFSYGAVHHGFSSYWSWDKARFAYALCCCTTEKQVKTCIFTGAWTPKKTIISSGFSITLGFGDETCYILALHIWGCPTKSANVSFGFGGNCDIFKIDKRAPLPA